MFWRLVTIFEPPFPFMEMSDFFKCCLDDKEITVVELDGVILGGGTISYYLFAKFDENEKNLMNDLLSKLEEHSVESEKNTICKKMIYADELKIFPEERKVAVNENEICFTCHEFDLLYFLASHRHQVFTKEQIYEAVWDDIPISVNAKVMCMISSIRHKLRANSKREYIHTIWGVGYKFDPET